MGRTHSLEIIVSADAIAGGNSSVVVKNGASFMEVIGLDFALGLLPQESEVQVIATGTVGNDTIHLLSRIIRESHVFVSLDLSSVQELTRVRNSPLQGNERLRSIHFPSNLVSINEYALAECSALVGTCIPATVQQIGSHAFYHCGLLSTLKFFDASGWFYNESPATDLDNPMDNPAKFTLPGSKYSSLPLYKKQ